MTTKGTKRVLTRHYRVINAQSYGGRLPKPVFHILDNGALATAELRAHCSDGKPARERAIICVHPKLIWTQKLVLRELIHEVVHIAYPVWKHGRKFEDEMIRVRRTAFTGPDPVW